MEEVIFALSSPPPPASLAMIRLDGDAAAAHLQSLVEESDRDPLPLLEARIPRMLQLKWDEVAPSTPALAVLWRRGASWTGNEGVEVVLPGSTPIIDGVLARLERAGARPATPGEFTRRAFVNGRIDLSSAESVAALIEAEDQAAIVAARRVMDGELAQGIRSVASSLLDVLAITEAGLDFSEQEVESPGTTGARRLLQPILVEIDQLLKRRQSTEVASGLPRILLWGLPNAGKSSLLNALVRQQLAIVDSAPGTTTDAVRGVLEGSGRSLEILDLPGERLASGQVEALALERARVLIGGDDPVLWVIDASRDVIDIERERSQLPSELKHRIRPVLCQCDRTSTVPDDYLTEAYRVSSLTGEGIEMLRQELLNWGIRTPGQQRSDALRFTTRQWHLVTGCRDLLAAAIDEADAGPELLVEDLKGALRRLEEVTGESTPEHVLDRIFSRFCLGK